MHGQFHANHVLYRNRPEIGHFYRQIVIHELESFLVLYGEGDVLQTGPTFAAAHPNALAGIHDNLEDALAAVQELFDVSVAEGWTPYQGEPS